MAEQKQKYRNGALESNNSRAVAPLFFLYGFFEKLYITSLRFPMLDESRSLGHSLLIICLAGTCHHFEITALFENLVMLWISQKNVYSHIQTNSCL